MARISSLLVLRSVTPGCLLRLATSPSHRQLTTQPQSHNNHNNHHQPHPPLNVGDAATLTKSFSQDDVSAFAALSADTNPLHFDADFARTTSFGKPIVHGILCLGLISAVIGTKLPGPGAVYVGQQIRFVRPVFIGDTVTATVKVLGFGENRPWMVTLSTVCTNHLHERVIDGKATILVPWLRPPSLPPTDDNNNNNNATAATSQ